ncbi:MAG: hypothetical protein GY716_10345 [bacterium]|nr:hypothetical protein [bacterium]
MKLSIGLVVAPFLVVAAGTPTDWWRTNPGGGGAFATAGAGPTGITLAASDLSGAYRSLDRGRSWDVIGAADGLTRTHVGGIGFDPVDASILYLGTDGGIFRSADSGATWTRVLSSGYISDVEISATAPGTGYAAYHPVWNSNDGRVYRSVDDGLTWSRISNGTLPSGLRILELFVHPTDADTVYLLAGEGRFNCGPPSVYRSQNGGASWVQLAPAVGQVMDFAVDRDHPGTLYVTTYGDVWEPGYDCVSLDPGGGNIYKSVDGGDTWSEIGQRTGIIWPASGGTVLRLIDVKNQFDWDPERGVWESTDGGANWTRTGDLLNWDRGWTEAYWSYGGSFNGDSKTLGEDLSDPDALFWANGQWIYATFDGGQTFGSLFTDEISPGRWQSRGVDNVVMFDLEISPADSRNIYVGFYDLGTFCSDDYGGSWRSCNHPDTTGNWGISGGNTLTVLADPTRAGVVWAAQAPSVNGTHTMLRSVDAGLTWSDPATAWSGPSMAGLSVDPGSPVNNRKLFATSDGDVFTSVDDGLTWSPVFDCNGCHFTAVDPFDSDVVYAAGAQGFWRSTAGGAPNTWDPVGTAAMTGSEGNQFWTRYWEGVSAIEVDPLRPGWIYAAVFGSGKGLYRSQDSGDTWTQLLVDDYLRGVAVSPADTTVIYSTSSSAMSDGGYNAQSRGVLRSTDDGQSWTQLDGLDWPFAVPIHIDPNQPSTVFVGSPGAGVMVTGSPVSGASAAGLGWNSVTGLSWDSTPGAVEYDLARGLLSTMRAQGDASSAAGLACRAGSSSIVASGTPPAGDGYFYVLRPRAGVVKGSWGNSGRDAVIGACE